jgi:multiple sugar transport system substrate-binding protein
MLTRFEQEHGCRIQVTELSWGDGKTKLFAAFNAKNAPDVLELGSDWVAQFSHAGVLRNLSHDGITLSDFAPFTTPPAMHKGSVFALPWTVDTRVLFYNKDLLRKAGLPDTPPTTFGQMLAACEKIRSLNVDGVYGFGVNGADEHRLYKKILSFFWSAGGDVFDGSGKPVLNTPQNVAALESYVALARCGFIETQRQLDNMFLRGNLGFVISGSWLLDKIAKENSSLNFGVALVPSLMGSVANTTLMNTASGSPVVPQSVSWAGGQYLAINAASAQTELAKKFIQYLTNSKTALEFCKTSNETGFPANKRTMNDPFFAAYPHRMVFAQQLETSRMTPIHPQWLDIEKIIEEATVEALLGRRTPQGALDAAQEQVSALIAKRTP